MTSSLSKIHVSDNLISMYCLCNALHCSLQHLILTVTTSLWMSHACPHPGQGQFNNGINEPPETSKPKFRIGYVSKHYPMNKLRLTVNTAKTFTSKICKPTTIDKKTTVSPTQKNHGGGCHYEDSHGFLGRFFS